MEWMIDLSGANNPKVIWPFIDSLGADKPNYAIVKGTLWTQRDGFSKDGLLSTHVAEASKRGIHVGIYHFLDQRCDPAQQAKYYLSVLSGYLVDMRPVVDWEHPNYSDPTESTGEVWVKTVEDALGYSPIVYINPDQIARDQLKVFPFFSRCPLWLAGYPNKIGADGFPLPGTYPRTPAPWSSVAAWQYTDSQMHKLPGPPLDRSVVMDGASLLIPANTDPPAGPTTTPSAQLDLQVGTDPIADADKKREDDNNAT